MPQSRQGYHILIYSVPEAVLQPEYQLTMRRLQLPNGNQDER
jgi:hypothetical protein